MWCAVLLVQELTANSVSLSTGKHLRSKNTRGPGGLRRRLETQHPKACRAQAALCLSSSGSKRLYQPFQWPRNPSVRPGSRRQPPRVPSRAAVSGVISYRGQRRLAEHLPSSPWREQHAGDGRGTRPALGTTAAQKVLKTPGQVVGSVHRSGSKSDSGRPAAVEF